LKARGYRKKNYTMASISWTRRDGRYDSLYWSAPPRRYSNKGIREPKAHGSNPGLWNYF